jgi:hypothetical protein
LFVQGKPSIAHVVAACATLAQWEVFHVFLWVIHALDAKSTATDCTFCGRERAKGARPTIIQLDVPVIPCIAKVGAVGVEVNSSPLIHRVSRKVRASSERATGGVVKTVVGPI